MGRFERPQRRLQSSNEYFSYGDCGVFARTDLNFQSSLTATCLHFVLLSFEAEEAGEAEVALGFILRHGVAKAPLEDSLTNEPHFRENRIFLDVTCASPHPFLLNDRSATLGSARAGSLVRTARAPPTMRLARLRPDPDDRGGRSAFGVTGSACSDSH